MEDLSKLKFVIKTVRPKYIAQACPVCRTFGTVGYAKRVCHACQGKGYVLLEASSEEVKK